MQHPVGEDVAPFRIGAELDLVDGQELHLAAERHGLHRADEIDRARRYDLLLAGDQRHPACPARLDHPVIDFPRQQPKWQADHAGGMAQHPLDRQMGLPRIGRAEHRLEHRRRSTGRTVAHGAKVGWESGEGKRGLRSANPAPSLIL